MPWIRTIEPQEATGELKAIYDLQLRRSGRVPNIVKLGSLNPESMRPGLELFQSVMHGPSGLTRPQREMVALVVSVANGCDY